MRPRHFLRLTAAGVLGLLTSIATAWAIALVRGEQVSAKAATIGIIKPDALLNLNEAADSGRRFRMIWYIDSVGKKATAAELAVKQEEWKLTQAAGDHHTWPDSWLTWGDLEREQEVLARRRQSAFGFPVVCLWYERSGGVSMFGSTARLHGGYDVTRALGRKRTGFVAEAALPLRPIWVGLLMNVAVYTGAWLGVLGVLARWRRATALRRGRCASCGYDMSGLAPDAVCPECGAVGRPSNRKFTVQSAENAE